MDINYLVKMANDIGGFFASGLDHEEAVDSIVQHLSNFWEPRMRRQIIEYARLGATGLKPVAREAVLRLDRRQRPG
jgi:formate dehydrogenase subunit delta